MTELEERVVTFVANERSTDPKKILLTDGIAQELGMDGDDAAELFEHFGKQFHIDLKALNSHWRQHFRGEPPLNSPGYAWALFISVVVGPLIHDLFRWIPTWAAVVVLIPLLCWIYARFIRKDKLPVTVADLVEAAESGRWVMQYAESKRLFHRRRFR